MVLGLRGSWRLFPPFIGRELREQYAGSLLGVAWSLLQPLLFILLYWWVFAAVLRTRREGGSSVVFQASGMRIIGNAIPAKPGE